jgi:hypothetical protein
MKSLMTSSSDGSYQCEKFCHNWLETLHYWQHALLVAVGMGALTIALQVAPMHTMTTMVVL